jgi:hypothetical protein
MSRGVPVAGICLYPITDYRGWDNERLCTVGLLSTPDERGRRVLDADLAAELHRQSSLFDAVEAADEPSLRIA